MSQRTLMAQSGVRSRSCSASNNTEAIRCRPSFSASSEISSHEALRSMAAAVLPPSGKALRASRRNDSVAVAASFVASGPSRNASCSTSNGAEANLWKPSASASSEISSSQAPRSIAAAAWLFSGRSSRNDWSSCSIFFISTQDTPDQDWKKLN